MEYNFQSIEEKWQKFWKENQTYKITEDPNKEKFYVLDMFPYPSGAGLHVGHPLGYIASDIYSRYKRLQGFNVLHPMGYDSFGLPAEQYAIQTGQHPAITTEENIARYRTQLDKIGFCYDWSREVRTSSPEYYKWTQWIFKQLFDCYYDNTTNKAERISKLVTTFETEGNANVNACSDCETVFSADEWIAFSTKEKETILQEYRMAYLADSWVNWCPALGTVLANDEVVNGVSERGGHPVVQKLMRQWSMRIKAYAERLLQGLETVDWTDSIKEQQRNWIGKSQGCSVRFKIADYKLQITDSNLQSSNLQSAINQSAIDVFTTRPDTIFGVSFMVLAPELDLVQAITTDAQRPEVEAYIKVASLKSERDRQSDVKNISGVFTGAYAVHPFTGEEIPIWIGDYVLASYGTGAVMAVPCGDQRDWDFAKHFDLPIKNIFADTDISEAAYAEKDAIIANSDFLNGLDCKTAMKKAIESIEAKGIGKGKTNYRLRDAVFSRQRYWGEPFPVYYKDELPYLVDDQHLPIELPEVDKYLPTEDGEPPLARAEKSAWNYAEGDRMEFNTMPGWAGSSWYFLRYMDPKNENEFVSKEKVDYWKNVDLYIGGSEHATGHLLYARFWTKFLFDQGYIPFEEPFQKMINQGMILGRSSFVYKIAVDSGGTFDYQKEERTLLPLKEFKPIFISFNKKQIIETYNKLNYLEKDEFEFKVEAEQILSEIKSYLTSETERVRNQFGGEGNFNWLNHLFIPNHVDIKYVDNDKLDLQAASNDSMYEHFKTAKFICEENGDYICGSEVEKMSKSKYNVQTPDELVEKFGADTLRMYEMFLGPLEQSKPWDTKGITGVHGFLKKYWRLFHLNGNFEVSDAEPTKDALKTLHKTIKKLRDDLDRFSFNTGVSSFMICVNELTDQKCNNRHVLEQLTILMAPYAPHVTEEIWSKLGYEAGTLIDATYPEFNEAHLVESAYNYPVSFNGKMRFVLNLSLDLSIEQIQEQVMANPDTIKWLEGKTPKKFIIVPGKIINMVL
jgi:leucyl-tRNA synthetase